MARLCERPGCSAPAEVGYGFDAKRHLVYVDVLPAEGGTAIRGGVLCEHHATAMTPPLGWWLDDLRETQPQLFRQQPTRERVQALASGSAGGKAGDQALARRRPRAQRPSSRRHFVDPTEELPFEIIATEPPPSLGLKPMAGGPRGESDVPAAVPWIPVFDRSDDLDGLLSARTPLLSKAFGAAPEKVASAETETRRKSG